MFYYDYYYYHHYYYYYSFFLLLLFECQQKNRRIEYSMLWLITLITNNTIIALHFIIVSVFYG